MFISFGLASMVSSILLLLSLGGMVPDGRTDILEGRERLTESIAISVNTMLVRSERDTRTRRHRRDESDPTLNEVGSFLAAVVERSPQLHSAAIRPPDGPLLMVVGDHSQWAPKVPGQSDDAAVQVPIFRGDAGQVWSTLELRFEPVVANSVVQSIWQAPLTRLLLPLGASCFLAFYLFLGRVLKQLDPAKAVPSRVRSALDTLAEGLMVLDREGRIVLANSAFSELYGTPPEKLVGQFADWLPWRTVVDGEPQQLPDGFVYPWTRSVEEGDAQSNVVLKLKTPAGLRTFVVNCSPVEGADGQTQGVLASFEDITVLEQKKIELERSMVAAEEANEAKSSFLANMSHEIRTPMNAILGFADVLRRGLVASDDERQRHLNTIHSSGRHLLDLINDILDLSKVEAGRLDIERTECSVHAIVSEVVSVLKVKADDQAIALTYVSEGPIPETVLCDPTRLRQIVTNLIGNGIKFTSEGGVTVTTQFEAARRGASARLLLEVADTGIGMEPAVCERIFDAFVQADSSTTRKFGGTGLGLAISKKFAEAMGGDIVATSEPGRGSVFRVTLELPELVPGARLVTVEEHHAEGPQTVASAALSAWTLPPRRVLVVDDGEENRRLIRLVLGRAGLTVDEAEDGLQAVEFVTACGDLDLILMDMQMPNLDGYGATRQLRSQGVTLPIVALTGNAMKGDEQKCLAAGCTGFLPKPVDLDDLLETVIASLGVDRIAVDAVAEGTPDSVVDQPSAGETGEAGPTDGCPAGGTEKADATSAPKDTIPRVAANGETTVDDAPEDALIAADDLLRSLGLDSDHDLVEANDDRGGKTPEDSREALVDETVLERVDALIEPGGACVTDGDLPAGDTAGELVDDEVIGPPIESTLAAADPDFAELVDSFVIRLKAEFAEFETCCDDGHWPRLSQHAHWLKGAAGTMGFADFTTPAAALEAAAKAHDRPECERLVAVLRRLIGRMVRPETVAVG